MTTWTGTPATITAGQTSGVSTAFNNHRDALKGLSEAWTAYTPTTGGTLTLGNGSWTGTAYSQVDKHLWFRVVLTFGTTTSVSGSLALSLPVAAKNIVNTPVGRASMVDASAPAIQFGTAILLSGAATLGVITTTGNYVTSTVPFTWATTDTLIIQGDYEGA